MKNILVYTILIAFVALYSCEREEGIKIKADPTAPEILTPATGSSFILLKDNAGNTIDFTWSKADFGFQASVTYVVQVDKQNNNFVSPAKLGSTDNIDTLHVTVGGLNKVLLDMGLVEEQESTIEMRIAAVINPNIDTLYSSASTFNATPYSTIITVPPIYLVGSGCAAGWDNNTNIQIKYSGADGIFITYAQLLADSEIKFLADKGAWAPQWGTDASGTSGGGNLVYRPTESDPDPTNIPTPTENGMYKITVDTSLLTYSVEAFNIGVVGSAAPNGWDAPDSKMSYDVENNVWTLTVDLIVGAIKFRLNDDWGWNLGGDINDLSQGGADILIDEAGNYTIALDISESPYTCTITKN